MKKKILIITGDNLGVANNQIEYDDIKFLKYPVIINDKEYRESEEYTAQYLINRFKKEKVSAHTQALVKGDLIDVIEANKDKYDVIIHVIMGSNMSAATYQMAESVRKEYADIIPIINIDTKQVVSGVGSILIRLTEILQDIDDINDVEKLIKEVIETTYTYLVLPDLNFLYRGGRIGKAKSLMGSLLRIIPIVGLFGEEDNPQMLPIGKARTFSAVNKIIIDNIKSKMKKYNLEKIKLVTLYDTEENKSDALKNLKEQVKNEINFGKMVIGKLRFAEAIHIGPKAWVITFVLR